MGRPIRQNYTPMTEKTLKILFTILLISIFLMVIFIILALLFESTFSSSVVIERLWATVVFFLGINIIITDSLITDARVKSSGQARSYGILGLIGFVCVLGGIVGIIAGSNALYNVFNFFFGGR